jgi:hypothetical protein
MCGFASERVGTVMPAPSSQPHGLPAAAGVHSTSEPALYAYPPCLPAGPLQRAPRGGAASAAGRVPLRLPEARLGLHPLQPPQQVGKNSYCCAFTQTAAGALVWHFVAAAMPRAAVAPRPRLACPIPRSALAHPDSPCFHCGAGPLRPRSSGAWRQCCCPCDDVAWQGAATLPVCETPWSPGCCVYAAPV